MDDEGTNQNTSKSQGAGGQASAMSLSNPLMRDFVSDWSPLHDASIHGRLLTLKKLIKQGLAFLQSMTHSDQRPENTSKAFQDSIQSNNCGLSRQEGSDVNLVTADQVSPLHEACLGGHAACASVLLKHGAQVNGVTVDWHTPLFNACVSGSVACLNLLLQHGASLHPPCDLASPIHEAAKRGHVQCVEFLASQGVNIDHDIKHLGTPLYVACENQQVNCAKKLLESGANVNSGKGLDSPLHVAARNCSAELVTLLIDFGADIWVKNAESKRPMELVPPSSPVGQLFLQKEGPLSLMQLCRLCIRRSFGHKQHQKITGLLLPDELKHFLLHV
ncbi:ankyrin repeat and SOCS box protein 9 isoform X1 [Ciconia boyciana]|uniref:ankyrin repeat and SOCS box protein 9 isoform X1 n=1 Tax=Ciconia boyciana TaxID=52775 RepID=UPI003BA2592F